MGSLTPTNEETLAEMVNELKPGESIRLQPEGSFIGVYVVPAGQDYQRDVSAENRRKWFRASMMAIELHELVWTAEPGVAAGYR